VFKPREKMQTQSKNTEFHEFVFSQVPKFDEFQSNIIKNA